MISAPVKKVLRDLLSDPIKNALLVLAIAVGVFAVGVILGGYSILKREMARNYMGSVPASATIKVDGAIDTALLARASALEGVSEVERHATILARMKVADDWYSMLLFVVDDFDNMKTNRFQRVSGEWPPPLGTMLIERTGVQLMRATEGDSVTVRTPHGTVRPVRVSGIVFDPGLAPSWQEQTGYGYVTLDTLQQFGEDQGFDELRVLFSGANQSPGAIEQKSRQVAQWVLSQGLAVHEIQVPPPRRHPHQTQMEAVLSLFVIFSFLTLLLAGILMATGITTLMTRQIRQIGIMKTIGARSAQVSGMYLLMVGALSISAILMAIPTSRFAAQGLVTDISALLNLNIVDAKIPVFVTLVQVAAGILIPLAVAAIPVWRAGRITVREALNHYGVSDAASRQGGPRAGVLAKMNLNSEVLTLAFRNVFRMRGRLAMTLGLLASGGAMFLTALNISKAWDENLGQIYKNRQYDMEVRFQFPVPFAPLQERLLRVPGVFRVEEYQHESTSFLKNSNFVELRTYPDKGHGSFAMIGVPADSKMVNFPLLEGQWLTGRGGNEAVLNHMTRALDPDVRVGDLVRLGLEGTASEWRVAGFVRDIGSPATAYVSASQMEALRHSPGTTMIRISFQDRSPEKLRPRARLVELALEQGGLPVSTVWTTSILQTAVGEHMRVLVRTLLAMAILMALIGVLGLTSSMSINVLERTRELSVLKVIGATPGRIRRMVQAEGMFIGAWSILLAIPPGAFLSAAVGRLIGNMAFRTPLPLVLSGTAVLLWLLIVLAGSWIATAYPAGRATGLPAARGLTYE